MKPTSYARWIDSWLYRRPFEGSSAARYAAHERPAFGDFDDRLIAELKLHGDERILDLGAGQSQLTAEIQRSWPRAHVVAVEPSRSLARPGVVRACCEHLPLADATFDIAICLSSIRHVRDRSASLLELRRVVKPGGRLVIVELDPRAPANRIENHAIRLGSLPLRWAFGPLVVRTAPSADAIAALAEGAGFRLTARRDDGAQPVYTMEFA